MLYNNQSYDFGQASFNMFGRFVQGISSVQIDAQQESQYNYGAGNRPTSLAQGRKTYTGSLVLQGFEAVALSKAVGAGKDYFDLPPFDLTISYGSSADQLSTEVLRGVKINQFSKSLANTQPTDEVTLSFIAATLEIT